MRRGMLRRKAALPQRPSTERLCCAVVESMSEAAVVVGDDGTIMYENGRFAEMLRMPPDEVVGLKLRDFFPEGGAREI